MPTIRTTMRPGDEIVVSQEEYEQLLDLGLIYDGTPPVEPADPFDVRVALRLADSDSQTRAAVNGLVSGAVEGVQDPFVASLVADTDSDTAAALRTTFGLVFVVPPPTGTAGTDTAAIQAQINAANTAGGGTVELQHGAYAMNAELVLRDAVHLRGKGRKATVLRWATDLGTGKYAIKPQTSPEHQTSAPYISDLTIAGPGENSYVIGVSPCNMDGWTVGRNSDATDIAVVGFRAGLTLPGDHNTFVRVKAGNNYYNVLWPSNWQTKSNHAFYSCDLSGATFATLAVEGNNTIDGSVFVGGHGGVSPYVIYKFDGPLGVSNAPAVHSTIFDMFAMESVGNAAILDESTGGGQQTLVGVTFNTPGHSWDPTRKIAARDADYGAKIRGASSTRVISGDYPILSGAVAAWHITPIYEPVGLTLLGNEVPVLAGNARGVRIENADFQAIYAIATAAITVRDLIAQGQNGGCRPYGQEGDRSFMGVALQSAVTDQPVAVAVFGQRIPVDFGAGGSLTGGIPVVPDPADLTRVIMAPGGGSTGYWNGRTATIPGPYPIIGQTFIDSGANSPGVISLQPRADRTYVAPHAVSALPTASAAYRGQMLRIEGGAGIADGLYICAKNASDAYGWRLVTVT